MENCESLPTSSSEAQMLDNLEILVVPGTSNQKIKVKRKSENEQSSLLCGKKQCNQAKTAENSDDLNIPSGSSIGKTQPNFNNSASGTQNLSRDSINPINFNSFNVINLNNNDSQLDFNNSSNSEEFIQWVNKFQSFSSWEKSQALNCLVKCCSMTQLRHVRRIIEPFFQRDFISQLPKELSLQVLSFLSPVDLLNCAATCRFWRCLAEDVLLWREKCAGRGICPDQLPPPPSGDPGQSETFTRCPWKAVFLRHSRVKANWRRGRPFREVVLRGHDDHVITCLQISGDTVVSGSDDTTLKVWSLESGRCLHTLTGHTGGVWCSQLTDDGDFVISGSTDRTVKIWDTRTGHCVFTLVGHTSTVRCMALKGDILISGSRDTTLRAWNIRTGQCVHVLTGHIAAVRCVQFDGRRAVSGAYDYTVKVWDVEREICVHTLAGHTNRVYSLQFDSERNIVVSGSLDTSIRVWDVLSGQCMFTLVGHQSLTSGMQLRDKILVSGNADSTLKVWDITTGRCLYTLAGPQKHLSAVTSLQFLQNGLVATSSDDGTVKLWDTVNGEFVCNITRLPSGGSGGCIWRLRATPTMLICAVGSRNGTEDTKLLVYDFNADYP